MKKNYTIALEVATYILTFDDLNVQALQYQLRCLSKQGSANKATFLFDKFCQKYQAAHAKAFEYDFKAFLKMDAEAMWEQM